MKTKSTQPDQSGAGLWLVEPEQPHSPPATQAQPTAQAQEPGAAKPAAPVLSEEAQQLVTELAAYGVIYDPAAPCQRCGCPLKYPLQLYPDTVVCCRCLPGGRHYGFERSERIYTLFPRTIWPLQTPKGGNWL
jgi:hypothetical protein